MKRLVAFITAFALAATLVGCGSTAPGTQQQEAGSQPGQQQQAQQASNSDKADSAQQSDAKAQTDKTQNDTAEKKSSESKDSKKDDDADKKPDYTKGTHHAIVKIKGYGRIRLEIKPEYAPVTAEEFCLLVDKKYYDGKRVFWFLTDIYARLGSSASKDKGVYCVRGEYEEAGYTGDDLSLKRGTLAMSRTEDGRSSDASSLILFLSDCSYLDGKYAAFARVTRGMSVIDEISAKVNSDSKKNKIDVSKNGKILDEDEQPVIKSIRMVD